MDLEMVWDLVRMNNDWIMRNVRSKDNGTENEAVKKCSTSQYKFTKYMKHHGRINL